MAAGALVGVRDVPYFQVIAIGAPFLHEKGTGEPLSGAVFLYDRAAIDDQTKAHRIQVYNLLLAQS